ncbi:hypothetical protein [Biostraticola tofi]|nr:hypothetical protein [Biostraticola tofi]
MGGEYKLPQQIIPKGRLLREPLWYQKIIFRLSNHYFSIARPLNNIEKNILRTSVRSVIRRSSDDINHRQLTVNILFKSKIIPSEFKSSLQNYLEAASRQATGIDEYLYDAIQIKSVNEMQRIAEGKLVIFLSNSLLKHTMVSLGNGQFVGSGNNIFNPILSSSPSVIVIEEMGNFVGDRFQFIDKINSALMFVGNVLGAKNTNAILMPTLPRKVSITYDRNGAPIVLRQNLPRQQILLGDDWDLHRDAGNPSSFILKAHGAPFNVNHHTAPELAHIIRGMVYSVFGVDDLSHFTRLELYTCYGGFGGIYSTAQILANELKIEVKSYPHKISEDIKRRHPHWFKIYRPITQSILESDREHLIALDRLKRRHERLHELANVLIRLRRRLISMHKRNTYIMLPIIYNHIVNVITQVEQVSTFCKTYDLASQHEIELRSIIEEYNIQSSDSDDIFLQCYMDVLHSIAPLKYLLHWFG